MQYTVKGKRSKHYGSKTDKCALVGSAPKGSTYKYCYGKGRKLYQKRIMPEPELEDILLGYR